METRVRSQSKKVSNSDLTCLSLSFDLRLPAPLARTKLMENYHRRPKTTKSKFESYDDSGSGSAGASRSKITTTQEHNRPQQYGVMVISPNGKIRSYVTRALEVLTEADNDGDDTTQQEGPDQEQEKAAKQSSQGTTAKSSSVCVWLETTPHTLDLGLL